MQNDALEMRAAHQLITAVEQDVRVIARRVAGADRSRVEELHQIGMQVVCERAPAHADASPDRFLKLVYHRVSGAMMNTLAAESAERRIQAALMATMEPVTVQLEEGDYFASEAARVAHRRRASAAVVAASMLTLLAEQTTPTPEAALADAEQRARVRKALMKAAASLSEDDWAMVQEVHVHKNTYAAVAERRNMSTSGVWARVENALEVLHRRMRESLRT